MSSKGFTLIELIVVVSLLVIIGGVGASIFASVFRSYNKANIINRVEQNGNYALSVMESQIRNAQSVSPTGVTCVDTLTITSQEGTDTEYRITSDVVQRTVGGAVEPLTGSDVRVLDPPDSCFTISSGTPSVVTIVLTLAQASGMTRVDYQAETTLRTTVVVRGGYK
jgi:prepilin-type N-terminal cleavage/methylation domain-containing protein